MNPAVNSLSMYRASSLVPPMFRQSITAGRPYFASCHSRNARPNSYWIASVFGLITTSRRASAGGTSRAGRTTYGMLSTTANAARMTIALVIIVSHPSAVACPRQPLVF